MINHREGGNGLERIAILGGTFNPPHLGHLVIANEVLHAYNLDEIWFMPNQEPPHKKKSREVRDEDRVHLLKLAISGHPKFKVELIELERQGPSYTYETMKLLKEIHPNKDFYFIIGADMIEYLPKWKNISQLLEMVKFIGVNRPAYNQKSTYPIQYVDVPDVGISSSMIRERMKEKKSIRYLVPESVRSYIKENELYGS